MEERRAGIELAKHRVRVPHVIDRADVAHEVAIGALREAPGKVDVDAGALAY
jgi:hypothetical protein